MRKCDKCGKNIRNLPFKCRYCKRYYCSEHRLPESHCCKDLEEKKKHNQERWINTLKDYFELSKLQREKSAHKSKKNFLSPFRKMSSLLRKRTHRAYNFPNRIRYLLQSITWFAIPLLAFLIFYSNISKLNKIQLGIIKLGGLLLLVSLFFMIKFGWRLLKETVSIIKRQRNWIKYFLLILLIIFLWQAYVNRTSVLDPFFEWHEQNDYSILWPFDLGEGESSNLESKINNLFSEDPEKYKTEPKTVNLRGIGNWVVYKGVHDYLSDQDRSISYYYNPPTTKDFILRDLNDDIQKEYLDLLVDEIRKKSENTNEQARISIKLVQAIPYDWSAFETDNIEGRYPYEVLYDMEGVCMEKANLMVYLLRGLGFGTAIFEYEIENHRAVGIKCSNGNYKTDYCFIEATDYYPVGQIPSNYVGGADIKNADPKLIIISDGKTYN